MTILLPEQEAALRELQAVCRELAVDVVLIGAVAFRIWMSDERRMTEDLDAVVALDIDELPRLTTRLIARQWWQDKHRELRWHSLRDARFDLLPVGSKARQQRQIIWPRAETRMSLVGFDHVFTDAVSSEVAPGLSTRVVPLAVLALLKIVSYLDDPHVREKDLSDLATLMRRYEQDGDRRFSDPVLDSGVEYGEAGAFLLGRDLRELCGGPGEADAVQRFLQCVRDPNFVVPIYLAGMVGKDDDDRMFARLAAALARGFESTSRST